ncbi:MAG TPA: DUF3857 domain-containing protein [Panacibacter sp.]|nr:DUF3857 domain-containing protein [Panacibacter sp.]
MKTLFSFLLFCCFYTLQAQDYSMLFLPDSLTKKADAVKRYEELHIIIKSIGKAVIKHKYAVTILNEQGDEYAEYGNYYDKLQDLSDISGTLFDAFGKKLRTVKKRDIADVSVDDGMSLMLDDRLKRHSFFWRQYPYTVEYEDEQELSGTFHLPSWQPVEDENYGVQQSRFVVETPADYQLHYKQFNYPGEPVIVKNASGNTYTWEIKNTVPVNYETFHPSYSEIVPSVYIAPSQFSVGGYTGNMDSWLNLGKFIVELNNGKDVLPDKTKQEVHQLTDGITDTKEKIAALYKYLQDNTRYISIQLGIGGWQPFDANYVATKRYGDCKALSNYMVSLLKEVGIKANYVLIKAGSHVSKGLWEDFPSPYFNHAVTCVPNGKDTIWLECTSQTEAAGFMGSFTGDRKALLIAEDGGHVVNTPTYTSNDNLQLRKINASIDEAGNLVSDVNTHFTGIQQELQHSLIHNASKEQRTKYLNSVINLPTYNVDKYDYKEQPGIIPAIDEYLHITSPGYATVSGKRLFVQPNLFNKSTTKLSKDSVRKFPIEYPNAYKDADTINITIPAGYIPEAIPSNTSISNKFGTYSISFKVTGDQIEVLRVQIRDRARYPASDYPDLVKFYDDIYKADRSRIVFIKKEN